MLAEAVERATSECQQRLGFLWGEEIPRDEPAGAPTADFHQEFYLWPGAHARLARWLEGAPARSARALLRPPVDLPGARRFVDLTPSCGLGGLCLVKALPGNEIPLVFGRAHPWAATPLPLDLEVHPVA